MRVNWLLPMLWAGFAICEVYKHNLRLVWPASIALESEIAAKLLSQGCFTSLVPRPSASSALLTFEFAYKEKLGGGQRSSGSTQGGSLGTRLLFCLFAVFANHSFFASSTAALTHALRSSTYTCIAQQHSGVFGSRDYWVQQAKEVLLHPLEALLDHALHCQMHI